MQLENNKKSKFSVFDELNEENVETRHTTSSKKDKVNYFSKYFKPVLFLVVVIIFGISYFLFFSPLLKDYQLLSASVIKDKKEGLKNHQTVFSELVQLNETYNQVPVHLKDKVLTLLPKQPDLASLYYNLEEIANGSNYKLLSFNIQLPESDQTKTGQNDFIVKPESDADLSSNNSLVVSPEEIDQLILSQTSSQQRVLREIDVDLTLEGAGYLNLKKFLDLLEHNLRLIDVESIVYSPSEQEIELNLKTYFYQ